MIKVQTVRKNILTAMLVTVAVAAVVALAGQSTVESQPQPRLFIKRVQVIQKGYLVPVAVSEEDPFLEIVVSIWSPLDFRSP